MTTGPGSVTLSTPQPIGSAGAPFQTVFLTGDVHGPVAASASGDSIQIGSFSNSASAANSIALGQFNSASTQYAIAIGNRAVSSGNQAGVGAVSNAIAIGAGAVNSTASSCLIGNSTIANIRANSTVCDLGTTTNNFKDIYSSGSIVGTSQTVAVNNIVSNTSTGVSGNLPSFVSAKVIGDSGIIASNVVTNSNATVAGNVPQFNSATNISDSGVAIANVVINTGASTAGDLCSFTGVSGKVITDSNIVAANVVTNSGTGVSGNIATFSSNKVIQDGGTALSALLTSATAAATYVPYTGATTTLAMGSQNITGTGAISAGTFAGSSITDSTLSTNGAITTAGGIGVAKAANIGTNLKVLGITDSTTTSTGSLQTAGGIGVALSATIGKFLNVNGGTTSTGVGSGTIITTGGLSAAKDVFFGGLLSVASRIVVNTTSAVAKIVVSGGVNNVGTEDSCIRAISPTDTAKIEIESKSTGGHNYELRSLSGGGFDITDRTGLATRFTIDTSGNVGIGMGPTGGGNNGLFIANGAGPTTIPSSGGALYVASGKLFYRGSSGTVTQLAVA